jgi:hypothetical protein
VARSLHSLNVLATECPTAAIEVMNKDARVVRQQRSDHIDVQPTVCGLVMQLS